jgi:A/G-specific adenine glycosylase
MANFFARSLLRWHKSNPRSLPWSDESPDPYRIWISEIIMQQTRINQGADYYLRFVKKFPTADALANASLDEVLRSWQGLGYYSRARNLHRAALYINETLNGQFPADYNSLLSLPGIGPYSAAAISSFAYGHRHAVVDGNVKRVLARFSGILHSIDDPNTHEEIRILATQLMTGVPSGLFNQAIMNFGALVCKPQNPLCDQCPLSLQCFAYLNGSTTTLPVRSKKKSNTVRHFHFFVIRYRGKIILHRRVAKDIWRGLYTPPILETASDKIPSIGRIHSFVKKILGHDNMELIASSSTVQQLLSHQTIIGRFLYIKLLSPPDVLPENHVWVSGKTADTFGKPKMIVTLFEQL